MVLLHDAVDSKKYDVRVVERNVTRGTLTLDEVEKMRKQLPDDGQNAEYVSIESLMNDPSVRD